MIESISQLSQNNKILMNILSNTTKYIKYEHGNIGTTGQKASVWIIKGGYWREGSVMLLERKWTVTSLVRQGKFKS